MRSVRKFYRFNVLEPVVVDARAWRAMPSSRSDARRATGAKGAEQPAVGFVEVELLNAMQTVALVESVTLNAPPGYAADPLTDGGATRPAPTMDDDLLTADPLAALDARCHLDPNERIRKLFALRRADPAPEEEGHFRDDNNALRDAGSITIVWRAAMGEGGSISTPAIPWKKSTHDDGGSDVGVIAPRRLVDVELKDLPPKRTFQLGVVTTVPAIVSNRSDRDLALQLQWRLEHMPAGISVDGDTFQNLGIVRAGASVTCRVRFLPLQPGLHSLTGCAVLDVNSAHEFNQPALADVLVR